jgi:hypothetical protein
MSNSMLSASARRVNASHESVASLSGTTPGDDDLPNSLGVKISTAVLMLTSVFFFVTGRGVINILQGIVGCTVAIEGFWGAVNYSKPVIVRVRYLALLVSFLLFEIYLDVCLHVLCSMFFSPIVCHICSLLMNSLKSFLLYSCFLRKCGYWFML